MASGFPSSREQCARFRLTRSCDGEIVTCEDTGWGDFGELQVAKRADRPYVAGRGRDWVKVKRRRSIYCVVVRLAGELATPKLVLGLRHPDGRLHH